MSTRPERTVAATGVENLGDTLPSTDGRTRWLAMPYRIRAVSRMPAPVAAMTDRARASASAFPPALPPSTCPRYPSIDELLACSLDGDTTPCRPTCASMKMQPATVTAIIAARPGLTRRCLTSSLTYSVPSQPVYMNTAIRNPAARPPLPPIPCKLNHALVMWNVPAWCPSTQIRPHTLNTAISRYSTTPIVTWVRAVSRMPTTAISSMTSAMAVAIAMLGQELVPDEPKTARTLGPSTSTGVSVPISVPATISQPVMNPR